VAFWATVVLVVLYVLSIGPACWFLGLSPNPDFSEDAYRQVYLPVLWAYDYGPPVLSKWIGWYCYLWMPEPPAPNSLPAEPDPIAI
jgi:hypothetical protein